MIYVKHFNRPIRNYRDSNGYKRPRVTGHYTGWYLFGFIPLLVKRNSVGL